MEESEVTGFVANVFKLFDANADQTLDFEEFTLAVTTRVAAAGSGGGAAEKPARKRKEEDPKARKLKWLFENVYDKVNTFDGY